MPNLPYDHPLRAERVHHVERGYTGPLGTLRLIARYSTAALALLDEGDASRLDMGDYQQQTALIQRTLAALLRSYQAQQASMEAWYTELARLDRAIEAAESEG